MVREGLWRGTAEAGGDARNFRMCCIWEYNE